MNQTRSQRKDARRAEILAAAARLFRRCGFSGVGIDDIGAAVGISGPAVYRHFPSKQALLTEVIDGYLDRLLAEHERLTAAGDRQPASIARASIAAALNDPDGLVVHLRQMPQLAPEEQARIQARSKQLLASWDDLLPAAETGRSHPAKALRLRACAGALIGSAFARSSWPAPYDPLVEPLILAVLEAKLPPSGDEPTPAEPDRPGEPAHLVPASRREAILAAATVLFRERDFNGVSLKDIGAAVGITASAVNRHFDSKEQLLVTIFDRAAAQIAAAISSALRRSPDPASAAVEIIKTYTGLAIDYRDLIIINATQMYSLPEAERARRRRGQRMYIDELRHVLTRARPELSADETRLRSNAAFALVNEVTMDDALSRRPHLAGELTALATAILEAPAN
ncbi:TetR/AcrR family transcriptional regulator [Saccharopolyspora sp. NPDC050642]|uniref:TetR/AcrR family transcriptional regulator n=1 Tax=Saccharopolyspora sp. NPDC050642 TaxID=3157099 RepID=UPI0033C42DDC